MKNRQNIIFFYIFLLVMQAFGQRSVQKDFVAYASQAQEHVYVHINKDVFTPSETLWFTAYIENSRQSASSISSNLLLGLYDVQGKRLHQDIHYAENGIASGSLLLDYPPGIYFVKAQTQWMRNFRESKPFIQKIEIINYGVANYTPESTTYVDTGADPKKPTADLTLRVLEAPTDFIVSCDKVAQANNLNAQKYTLTFHNNQAIQVVSIELENNKKVLRVPKTKLSKGVNTILLLDNKGRLLQERLIYNETSFKPKIDIQATVIEKHADSITLKLEEQNNVAFKNASISVLPLESQGLSYQQEVEAQKTFRNVLVPGDKKLFVPVNKRAVLRLNEELAFAKNSLDLSKIKNVDTTSVHSRERGFTIRGTITNWSNKEKGIISFYQKGVGTLQYTEVQADGSFEFTESYIEKGELLNVSVTKNGKTISDPKIDIDLYPELREDSLHVITLTPQRDTIVTPIPLLEPITITDKEIALNEVEITGTSRKKNLTRNKKFVESDFYEGIKITTDIAKKSPTISSLIRRLGYVTRQNPKNGRFFVLPRNPVKSAPDIIVDGFLEREGILDVPLTSIDEIYYENVGISGDVSGVIYIYRKLGAPVGIRKEGVVSIAVPQGFTKQQPYFNEILSDRLDTFTKRFAALYWDGTLTIESEVVITFPKKGTDGALIVIQGLTSTGLPFSVKKEIVFD